MNYRSIFSRIGKILIYSAVFYVFPVICALCAREFDEIRAFLIPAGISLLLGVLLCLIFRSYEKARIKEGVVIVGISWILISVFGALALYLTGAVENYVDCLFEMVSGFTTTGASILTDFDLPKCVHFWRAFSHWLGGMGILVFMLALLPKSDASDFQLMKFESPGPQVGKLVSKLHFSATILYVIYFAFTLLEFLFLKLGGMDLFNSVIVSLSTAGTGGFASTAESIREFDSAYVDIVITVFMFIFSINFNLYFLILVGKITSALFDEELRFYLLFLLVAILGTTTANTFLVADYGKNFFTSLRYSAFSVVSVSSTTGFMTTDFASDWPLISQTILLITMSMGAMAGSTGGGLKASRALILLKAGRQDTLRVLRPSGVYSVKMNKKPLTDSLISSVRHYFALAVFLLMLSTLLLSFDKGLDFITSFTASLTCFNNVGPGLGQIIGPCGSYATLSYFSKSVLTVLMLIGRLEIFPIFLLLSPKTWSKEY